MNNTDILITIGIAAYNCQRFIGEALESALQQSHQNLEILIYNDASTDNTQSILNRYNDPRIRVIQGLHNQGVAHARQTIKQQAKGEYLTWLDSDDVFFNNRVEELLKIAIHNKSDLTIDRYLLIDEQGNYICKADKIRDELSVDIHFTRLFERNFMPAHPLISRRCYINIDYDTNLKTSEDYDYWLKCSIAAYRFYCTKRTLTKYRIRKNSLSSSLNNSLASTKAIINKHSLRKITHLYKRRKLNNHINKMTYFRYIFNRDYHKAIKYVKEPWGVEENCDYNFYKGTALLVLEDYQSAQKFLEKHLNNHPQSPAGLNNLGLCMMHQEKQEYTTYWEKALELFPEYQDSKENLLGKKQITFNQLTNRKLR